MELEIEEEQEIEKTTTPRAPDSEWEHPGEDSTTPVSTISEQAIKNLADQQDSNRCMTISYSHNLFMAADNQHDPSSIAEANSSPDKDKWKERWNHFIRIRCGSW